MNIRTNRSMGAKARRLKAALLTLALSVVMLSVGITGTHPGDNDGATRSGGGLPAPTVPPAPTARPRRAIDRLDREGPSIAERATALALALACNH